MRLLPQRVAYSPLLLERRVAVPRHGSEAAVEVSLPLVTQEKVTVPAQLRLGLEGSGPVPLDAVRVRAVGWSRVWEEWALNTVRPDAADARRAIASSRRWRAVFPDAPATLELELLPRLNGKLEALRVVRADLDLKEADAALRAAAGAELARLWPQRGRLVVLGLDALDWRLVDELTSRGVMPNLRRLLQRSAQATLHVPQPLISPVVWTTLATGVPPEQHGVLDFLENDASGGTRPVSSASRKAPAFWEMAAAAGRSTAVIGWWATFPAKAPQRGRVYSDRLTEQLLGLSEWVPGQADPQPADATARKLVVGADRITPASLRPFAQVSESELASARKGGGWDTPAGGLAKLLAATLTVEALTDYELGARSDVVLAYLEGTDTVGHLFAQYRAPAMPGVNPADAARFAAVVDRYYAHVDGWIGRVAAMLGAADTLAIVSDHGFTWGRDRPRVPAGAHTATAVWWHRDEGVFIVSGPSIRPSPKRERMEALDVVPVLLHVSGLPRAAEMTGRLPGWLFPQPERPSTAVRYDALLSPERAVPVELPKKARDEELAKLQALGYIGGTTASSRTENTVTSGSPARDGRAEARRLTNLGTSRASAGDEAAAQEAFRQAAAADPTFAAAWYNLSLMKRKEGKLDEADALFWRAVDAGIADRELAVVRLALDYRQRRELTRARTVLAEGRARFPSSPAIWLNSGVFLGEQGEIAAARTCLERAVQLAPGSAEAHRNLGVAFLADGQKEAAGRELREALRLDPSLTDVRRQLDALGLR